MSETNLPIIVGAGPVGLGAGLFLARAGLRTRLVEMRAEPSLRSKALAVNPRTLEILEESGVTRQMLELGKPIRGACLHLGESEVREISLSDLPSKYPFMLALSQASTERLLTAALEAQGGKIERGTKLVHCRAATGGAEVTLEPAAGGPAETVVAPWMLAADGAHSTARHELGIDFPGASFDAEWYLADVPVDLDLAQDRAHIFIRKAGGFLFLLPVIDERLAAMGGDPVWRVISSRPDPIAQIPGVRHSAPAIWESSFRVAHRVNARMQAGPIYFAGDAAHVHSPMGARGMNLGLEDAWIFAQLAAKGRLEEYHRHRHPVDADVVRKVRLLSTVVAAESGPVAFLRSVLFPILLGIPFLRRTMFRTLSGLDHLLPADLAPKTA